MNEPTNAYLRTRVLSAGPDELRLILLDGALRFARLGRNGLAQRNYEQSFIGLNRCQAILMELIDSLRPEHAPDLCSKLAGVYTFMYRRLMDATLEKSPQIVDEVVHLLEYERETWTLLMQKLRGPDSASASTAANASASAPPSAHPRAGLSSLAAGTVANGASLSIQA